MKTKLLLLNLLFIFITIDTNGQNINNFKHIQEYKSGCNTYFLGDEEIGYTVWNSKNTLKNITPKYLQDEYSPRIELSNKTTLDNFVRIYLKPFFVNSNNFSYPYLYIYLFGDNIGNIKEIMIRYPKNIGIIPFKKIEEFETSVKNSIKLSFDKEYSGFKESEWIGTPVLYNIKDVKNM